MYTEQRKCGMLFKLHTMLVHVQEEIPSETTPQDIQEFSATLYLDKVLAQQQTKAL